MRVSCGRFFAGYHLVPTAAGLGVSAGMTVDDPIEGRYFRANSETYHSFNQVFTGTTTTAEILAAPIAFYLGGLVRKDSYAEHTALLSAQAVADVEIPNVILRTSTRRLRPPDIPINGNFSDTWFDAGTNPLKRREAFASGHAASAFALAIVVARRYSHRRWVPLCGIWNVRTGRLVPSLYRRAFPAGHSFRKRDGLCRWPLRSPTAIVTPLLRCEGFGSRRPRIWR